MELIFLNLASVHLCAQSVMSDSLRSHGLYVACQAPLFMGFPRQEYWIGLHFLLQGIFPTQGSSLGLPHCRWIFYHLSYHGSPFFLLGSNNTQLEPIIQFKTKNKHMDLEIKIKSNK